MSEQEQRTTENQKNEDNNKKKQKPETMEVKIQKKIKNLKEKLMENKDTQQLQTHKGIYKKHTYQQNFKTHRQENLGNCKVKVMCDL